MGAATAGSAEAGITTKVSPRSVPDTVARLRHLLASKGITVFAVIDQAAEARAVGLDLRDTVLVVFGNPEGGTPVMAASPLVAVDLPLKILVWDHDGETDVSYTATSALASRYHLDPELAAKLAGIDPLTDALCAP